MASISSTCYDSYYGSVSWNQRTGMELISGRWARLSFHSLSSGKVISSLSLSFNKTNTGGGGYFTVYASTNGAIQPGDVPTYAQYVGTSSIFGSGAGWKTVTLDSNVLSMFTGDFFLFFYCNVAVDFSGYGSSAPNFSGTAYDGSIWDNVGGIWRKGNIWDNVGGIWHLGIQWDNVGGIWKRGIA